MLIHCASHAQVRILPLSRHSFSFVLLRFASLPFQHKLLANNSENKHATTALASSLTTLHDKDLDIIVLLVCLLSPISLMAPKISITQIYCSHQCIYYTDVFFVTSTHSKNLWFWYSSYPNSYSIQAILNW